VQDQDQKTKIGQTRVHLEFLRISVVELLYSITPPTLVLGLEENSQKNSNQNNHTEIWPEGSNKTNDIRHRSNKLEE
jgi:hypothetical protein